MKKSGSFFSACGNIPAGIALAAAVGLSACAPSRPPARTAPPPEALVEDAPRSAPPRGTPEVGEDQKTMVAHEFFLRARQQELAGNGAMALRYYQIAYAYDAENRDLCFLLVEQWRAAEKPDSALAMGQKCLELKGEAAKQEYRTLAEIYLRKGEVQNSLAFYNRALELDDGDKDILYTLAGLYGGLKDLPKQTAVMEKLLPLVDFPPQMVEQQARNYRMLGKEDSVVVLFRSAWEKTGNSFFGEKLSDFYGEQEMYGSQLDALRKLARENPENPRHEPRLARALMLGGKSDSALTAYERLAAKHPDEAEYLQPYGVLLFEKRRYREAREIFGKLVKSQPGLAANHFFLGSTGVELKDKALAEAELKKAVEIEAKVPEYWAKLAFFYLLEGDVKKALELPEKSDGGKDWRAWHFKGTVCVLAGRRTGVGTAAAVAENAVEPRDSAASSGIRRLREKGVDYFRKALAQSAGNRRVLFDLGVALEELNRRGESIETMRQLVNADSNDAVALNYLGYMLVEENQDLDRAGALIERALSLDPGNGAFLDSKGWWFYRKKDFAQARKYVEMAEERIPQDPTILEHLALILEKSGESLAAREKWRQILKLNPNHELARRKLN